MFVIGILPALMLLYVRRWVEEPAVWIAASRDRREAQQRVQMGSGSAHDKQLAQFTVSEIVTDNDLCRRVGLLTNCSQFHGICSSTDSGVCPKDSRYFLDGFFFRFLIFP
jgi:hypothetical protein